MMMIWWANRPLKFITCLVLSSVFFLFLFHFNDGLSSFHPTLLDLVCATRRIYAFQIYLVNRNPLHPQKSVHFFFFGMKNTSHQTTEEWVEWKIRTISSLSCRILSSQKRNPNEGSYRFLFRLIHTHVVFSFTRRSNMNFEMAKQLIMDWGPLLLWEWRWIWCFSQRGSWSKAMPKQQIPSAGGWEPFIYSL